MLVIQKNELGNEYIEDIPSIQFNFDDGIFYYNGPATKIERSTGHSVTERGKNSLYSSWLNSLGKTSPVSSRPVEESSYDSDFE
jgi:hypothetical protein